MAMEEEEDEGQEEDCFTEMLTVCRQHLCEGDGRRDESA